MRGTVAGASTATAGGLKSSCFDYVPGHEFVRLSLQSFGQERLSIHIGAVRIHIEGISTAQRRVLQARYGVFAREATGDPALIVSLTDARREAFLVCAPPPGEIEMYRIATSWHGSILQATSYEWSSWIDFDSGKASLALTDLAQADGAAFHRSVENFLRVACSHLLLRQGAFLFHSAGLVVDGMAYVFFGPSGSGKTTVTELSPEALILSDDLTLIERGPEGEPRACSIPFRGVFAPEPASIESFPVAGLFRLVQDPGDSLETLTGARAIGEVVGSLPFVTENDEMLGPVLDVVERAASFVPVCRLRFTKSRNFWKTLSEAGLARPVDSFSTFQGMKA